MRKLFVRHSGNLVLLVMFLGGCSSFHNVSMRSFGEETKKDPDAPPSPIIVLDHASNPVSPLENEQSFYDSSGLSTRSHNQSPESIIHTQSADEGFLPWSLKDIFFDYDQYTIRTEDISALEQNAKVLLKRYPNKKVLIEGHCDERGTEEYNLILGDRRAMAVKTYLIDLGVPAASLQVLSLGKNEPFCLQPTLPCFQQNRRVHFVLK